MDNTRPYMGTFMIGDHKQVIGASNRFYCRVSTFSCAEIGFLAHRKDMKLYHDVETQYVDLNLNIGLYRFSCRLSCRLHHFASLRFDWKP